jgi:DNA adenine methylase
MTLLKWVGGKTQLLEKILPFFPTTIQNYYEPFIGGGSVLLAVLDSSIDIKGTIYASDVNKLLINFYKAVQSNPALFWNTLSVYIQEYNSFKNVKGDKVSDYDSIDSKEGYYYWVRHKYNQRSKAYMSNTIDYHLAAMLLFLNKTCFRGLYREGPNGFNVPFGNYKQPTIASYALIVNMSEKIKDVVFEHMSYENVLSNTFEKGDFIYMDPPYIPEKATSFDSYTTSEFDHSHFIEMCKEIKMASIVMSNANVPILHKEFDSYDIHVVECRRAIHSKDPSSKTTEVIICKFDF